MRKFLAMVVVAAFLAMGVASAQDNMSGSTQWAGVGLGFPVTFYYGLEDGLGQDLDLRFGVSSYFFNLNVIGDVLVPITTIEDIPIDIYGGGGPTLSIWFGGGVGLGLRGLVGGEYMITDEIGAFAELGVGYTFYFNDIDDLFLGGFAPGGTIGVNFHF